MDLMTFLQNHAQGQPGQQPSNPQLPDMQQPQTIGDFGAAMRNWAAQYPHGGGGMHAWFASRPDIRQYLGQGNIGELMSQHPGWHWRMPTMPQQQGGM